MSIVFFFLFYKSKNASNTFLNTLHYTNFKIKKVFFSIDIPNLVITFCLVLHFIRLTKVKPNEMQKSKALKNINIDIFFWKSFIIAKLVHSILYHLISFIPSILQTISLKSMSDRGTFKIHQIVKCQWFLVITFKSTSLISQIKFQFSNHKINFLTNINLPTLYQKPIFLFFQGAFFSQ